MFCDLSGIHTFLFLLVSFDPVRLVKHFLFNHYWSKNYISCENSVLFIIIISLLILQLWTRSVLKKEYNCLVLSINRDTCKFKNLLAWPKCDFINFAGTNENLLAIAQLIYKLLYMYLTALHYYPGCGRTSMWVLKSIRRNTVYMYIPFGYTPGTGSRETIQC